MGEPILKPKQDYHWVTALPGDALPAPSVLVCEENEDMMKRLGEDFR